MRLRVSSKHIPVLSTLAVFVLLYAIGALCFKGFFSLAVFVGLFRDNSFLGIAAVGMTFVILSRGIDLSVGSVMALSTVVLALLLERGVSPVAATAAVLAMGALMGFLMGSAIHFLGLAPFIVTLAGLFFARGVALALCEGAVSIRNPAHQRLAAWALPVGSTGLPLTAIVFLAVLAAGIYASTCLPFGRNVYAIGGNEEAAMLMGVPVGPTKLGVYTVSGSCAALAGVVSTLYKPSGDPSSAVGMELDVIAAVVVGGTLLSGGVGGMPGTLLGVLIFGIIGKGLDYMNLSTWWAKVAIGVLLLGFVLLQKLLARTGAGGT